MILTLEVTGPQASPLGAARRKVFGVEGGSIGRLPDNDWVLADSDVSRPACDHSLPRRRVLHRGYESEWRVRQLGRRTHRSRSPPSDCIGRSDPHPPVTEIEAQVSTESMPGFDSGSPGDNPFLSIEASFPQSSLSPVPADRCRGLGCARTGPRRRKALPARGLPEALHSGRTTPRPWSHPNRNLN